MKNIKKITYCLIITLFTLLLLPINVYAANEVAIFYDELTDEYLIYTDNYNDTCEYALSNTTVKPAVFQTCSKDNYNNNVIKVSSINKGNAIYLWTQKDNSTPMLDAFDLTSYYNNALYSSESDFIGTTTKRIGVQYGERSITITDTNYSNYKYVIVKVDDNDYNSLVSRTSGLNTLSSSSNPLAAILLMNSFKSSYESLLPSETDSRWLDLSSDKIINEPLDTQTGDVYVVWLMAYAYDDSESVLVYDMQIMYCLRDDETVVVEYTQEFVKKLPYTGMNQVLEGLLCANIVLLPVAYLRKRKLTKSNDEK